MLSSVPLFGMKGYGKKTAAAGSGIAILVEPMPNAYTAITNIVATVGTTAHTVTVMRPIGSTTLASATAAGTSGLVLSADPGNYVSTSGSNARGVTYSTSGNAIAANDYVVIETPDGAFFMTYILAGTVYNALQMKDNAPAITGLAAGAKCWFYGIATDTNPVDAQAHPAFNTVVSTSGQTIGNTAGEANGTLVQSFGKYEPLIVRQDNATVAGTIERVNAIWINKPGPNTTNIGQ